MSELGRSLHIGGFVAAVALVGVAFVQCGTTNFGSAGDSGADATGATKGHGSTSTGSSGTSTGSAASGSSGSSAGTPDAGPVPDASGDAGRKPDTGASPQLCEDRLTCGADLCCKRIHIGTGIPYPDAGECQPICFDAPDAGLHERRTCAAARDCVGNDPTCCEYPDSGVSVCETPSLCKGPQRCADGGLCTGGEVCCGFKSLQGVTTYMCGMTEDDAGMCTVAVGAVGDAGIP